MNPIVMIYLGTLKCESLLLRKKGKERINYLFYNVLLVWIRGEIYSVAKIDRDWVRGGVGEM